MPAELSPLTQRRHHYEQAFETFLRSRRIPYVAVDEAKRALLPEDHNLRLTITDQGGQKNVALKSFDFVIYGQDGVRPTDPNQPANLLVEIKGRKVARRPRKAGDSEEHPRSSIPTAGQNRGRLESWVTQEDVDSLHTWEKLFGPEFAAAFVFVYWCDEQPPDGLFQEVFEHRGRWYAIRAVRLDMYRRLMKPRSLSWGTVHLSTEDFERASQPFSGRVERL